jgi:membrane associated rhomboid family serine protease
MDLPLSPDSDDPQAQARRDRHRFRTALLVSGLFVVLLWWIHLLQAWLQQPLGALGVRPGEWSGLIGVIAAPLIHGSTKHLVGNTLPLLVLGVLAFATYPRTAWRAVALIWLLSGLGIWLFGRPSTHIGASGINHGLMFLLFALGLIRRDRPAIAAMFIAFFMYGGMLLTVLPGDPEVSWEAHLFGAIAGVVAALIWRKRDPAPPRKRYSWEDEELQPMESVLQSGERDTLEPPPPSQVPVLWQRPPPTPNGVVLVFRPRPAPLSPPPTEPTPSAE